MLNVLSRSCRRPPSSRMFWLPTSHRHDSRHAACLVFAPCPVTTPTIRRDIDLDRKSISMLPSRHLWIVKDAFHMFVRSLVIRFAISMELSSSDRSSSETRANDNDVDVNLSLISRRCSFYACQTTASNSNDVVPTRRWTSSFIVSSRHHHFRVPSLVLDGTINSTTIHDAVRQRLPSLRHHLLESDR
jgi:hypothetical protein